MTGYWHKCLADPACPRRVKPQDWCCGQHRGLLLAATGDWRLGAEISSAWAQRLNSPDRYVLAKRRALEALRQYLPKEKADGDNPQAVLDPSQQDP